MLRVVGLASAVPFDQENPAGPVNRRISIIVMNREAEEAVTKADKADVEAESRTDVARALQESATTAPAPEKEVPGAAPAKR
jgi:chemotaxis protein MotB